MLFTKKMFFLSLTLIVAISLFAVSVSAQSDNNSEANRAWWLEWWEVEAQHDYSQMNRFFTDDITRHSAATNAIMPEAPITNLAEYTAFLEGTAAMFPDYRIIPEMVIAEGDIVAFYGIFDGTFIENNNPMKVPMMGFARFENGLVAELWVEWDNLTWDRQMTAVESPVESIEDIAGIWRIFNSTGSPLSMEITVDGTVILGYTPTTGEGAVGTFTISNGQMLNNPGEYADCEAVYNVYVSRLDTGKIQYIRHELVGEDCWESRIASLDGTIVYPWTER